MADTVYYEDRDVHIGDDYVRMGRPRFDPGRIHHFAVSTDTSSGFPLSFIGFWLLFLVVAFALAILLPHSPTGSYAQSWTDFVMPVAATLFAVLVVGSWKYRPSLTITAWDKYQRLGWYTTGDFTQAHKIVSALRFATEHAAMSADPNYSPEWNVAVLYSSEVAAVTTEWIWLMGRYSSVTDLQNARVRLRRSDPWFFPLAQLALFAFYLQKTLAPLFSTFPLVRDGTILFPVDWLNALSYGILVGMWAAVATIGMIVRYGHPYYTVELTGHLSPYNPNRTRTEDAFYTADRAEAEQIAAAITTAMQAHDPAPSDLGLAQRYAPSR